MLRRGFFVWLHRWSGLAMTIFLVIVGLTGSALAFREALDAWLNPGLFTVAKRDTPMLDPFVLREKASAFYPDERFDIVRLHVEPGGSVEFVARSRTSIAVRYSFISTPIPVRSSAPEPGARSRLRDETSCISSIAYI